LTDDHRNVRIRTYIHTRNSSGRTAEMAGIHRGPLRGPERFVTQHAQSAGHELHTSGGKGGRGQRRDTRQHFCDSRAVALRAAHRSRQGTRAWGRSLIGELTLHRVRVGPRRHANTGTASGRQPSPHYRSSRRDGARWRGRAALVAQARSSGHSYTYIVHCSHAARTMHQLAHRQFRESAGTKCVALPEVSSGVHLAMLLCWHGPLAL